MEAQEGCGFKEPVDIREILDLLAKLDAGHEAWQNVAKKLEDESLNYFKEDASSQPTLTTTLPSVFSAAKNVREKILKSPTDEKYSDIQSHLSHPHCITGALKKSLPKAFSTLYYLYFMGSKTGHLKIKGGQWYNCACNGTDYYYRSSGSKVDLYNWLTDMNGQNSGLVRRGFPQDTHSFTSNTGETVATVIANIIKHDNPGPLQNVFFYLMFVSPWDHSLLGHAILFIWTFFVQVNKSKDSGFADLKEHKSGDFEKLNGIWEQLKEFLLPLAQGRHGSHDTSLSAVCHHNNSNLFDNIWDPKAFPFYFEWLKDNLDNIKKSLQEMLKDSSNWTSANLKNSDSAGSFKYGFVFTDSWKDGNINSKLSPFIEGLTGAGPGSLGELKECLEKFSSGSSGSSGVTAGGTAGGILGTAGLGAGVAYATNAFGLKDIITGLISGFLK
ncbi:hypothetical protein X943_001020 [Babesia divergens]|uniref:Uncharacterized protein n=1 Tax=Babesia divergens TaxID=32595 RepID=A0AAD9GF65_BABDI|nr:hypothetical protein X943_001020 [Babesia divergens]